MRGKRRTVCIYMVTKSRSYTGLRANEGRKKGNRLNNNQNFKDLAIFLCASVSTVLSRTSAYG